MERGQNLSSNVNKSQSSFATAESDSKQRESIICDNLATKTDSFTDRDTSSTATKAASFESQRNEISFCSTSNRDNEIAMDELTPSRSNLDELHIEKIDLKEGTEGSDTPNNVEMKGVGTPQGNNTCNITSPSKDKDDDVLGNQIGNSDCSAAEEAQQIEHNNKLDGNVTCDKPNETGIVTNPTQNETNDNLINSEALCGNEKTDNVANSTNIPDNSNTTTDKKEATVNGCELADVGLDSFVEMDANPVEQSNLSSVESRNVFNTIQAAIESSEDSESDSSSSDKSTSSGSSEKKAKQNNDTTNSKDKEKRGETLVRGEMSLDDLPPIEELSISVSREECEAIGRVYSIVKQLVVIESLPNTPALNLDTVLFRESGKPLGEIFDVFGPVKGPFYCVRFNKHEDIVEKGIEKGELIYCAPQTDYTRYVFTYRLMMEKGSDASWRHDVEVPEELQDYSDDEAERTARQGNRNFAGDSNENGSNRKRRHNNNNFTMGEEWYRARIDERRRGGVPSSQPRLPVFSPVTPYRPSTPSPFSARQPQRAAAPFTAPIVQTSSQSNNQLRSPFTSPPGPPPTPLGARLAMYSPQPPPAMTGPFSKPPTFGPPFGSSVPGTYPAGGVRQPQNHSFGSQNPFNFPSILPTPPLEVPPPLFSIPPPRIGCPPRPNVLSLPPRQPPPPRPPAFSRHSQYNMY